MMPQLMLHILFGISINCTLDQLMRTEKEKHLSKTRISLCSIILIAICNLNVALITQAIRISDMTGCFITCPV